MAISPKAFVELAKKGVSRAQQSDDQDPESRESSQKSLETKEDELRIYMNL